MRQYTKIILTVFICGLCAVSQAQSVVLETTAPADAPGTVQTVTAFVNGLGNDSVTWTVSPTATLYGLNPGPKDENNVIGVYSTATNTTYTVTATSVADNTKSASTTVKFTTSPVPVTDHPRLLLTSSMISALKTKAASGTDAAFTLLQNRAGTKYTGGQSYIATYSTWNGTACTGGSGVTNNIGAYEYMELDALDMIEDALVDPSTANQQKYGCAARDVWMAEAHWFIGNPSLLEGNRFGDSGDIFAYITDYLLATPYLSTADIAESRALLAVFAKFYVTNPSGNGTVALIGSYNSPAQLQASNAASQGLIRAFGNNYTRSRIAGLVASSLTFNDTTADDPIITTAGSVIATDVYYDGTWHGGTGYVVGNTFTISCGGTTLPIGVVDTVSSGAVTSFHLSNNGAGCVNLNRYTSGTATTATSGTGTGLLVSFLAGNTCGSTVRNTVCADGSATNLHAYWTYLAGGMLYQDYIHLENPNVAQQALNAKYSNIPSIPQCNTSWTASYGGTVSCMGDGRNGESVEGYWYGTEDFKLRDALTAIHTAGYDDPELYGPQMSLANMSYWDEHLIADAAHWLGRNGYSSTGTTNTKWAWSFDANGDSDHLYILGNQSELGASSLLYESIIGRTDNNNALEWFALNGPWGGPAGTDNGCSNSSYCGWKVQVANDDGGDALWPLFIALPAVDPTVAPNLPTYPQTSFPTDWYGAGNRHTVIHDPGTGGAWAADANTIFMSWCPITVVDHEHEFCGGFRVMSNGEYITKGRLEFNDYNSWMSTAMNQNVPVILENPGQTTCTMENYSCSIYTSAVLTGGQWWEGQEAGPGQFYHAEFPSYVSQVYDSTQFYNGCCEPGTWNQTVGSSRTLIDLRASNMILYYDRADTGTNAWPKSLSILTTGSATITGNTAIWSTRSGTQKAAYTQLNGTAPVYSALPSYDMMTLPFSTLQSATTMQATCSISKADGTGTLDVTSNPETIWWSTNSGNVSVSSTGLVTATGGVGSGAYLGCVYRGVQVFEGSAPNSTYVTVGSASSGGVTNLATDQNQLEDWELAGQVKTSSGSVASAYYISVLQWMPSASTPVTATSVASSAGNVFDGVLAGTNLVMFHRSRAETFTGVTYPASGATTQYVADLTPSTAYNITGTGTPASATTDTSGMLKFAATGTGNITVGAATPPPGAMIFTGNWTGLLGH